MAGQAHSTSEPSDLDACFMQMWKVTLEPTMTWSTCMARLTLTECLQDGYGREEGVEYRVMNGVVETKPGQDCYGIVDIYDSVLRLRGSGSVASQDFALSRIQHDDHATSKLDLNAA